MRRLLSQRRAMLAALMLCLVPMPCSAADPTLREIIQHLRQREAHIETLQIVLEDSTPVSTKLHLAGLDLNSDLLGLYGRHDRLTWTNGGSYRISSGSLSDGQVVQRRLHGSTGDRNYELRTDWQDPHRWSEYYISPPLRRDQTSWAPQHICLTGIVAGRHWLGESLSQSSTVTLQGFKERNGVRYAVVETEVASPNGPQRLTYWLDSTHDWLPALVEHSSTNPYGVETRMDSNTITEFDQFGTSLWFPKAGFIGDSVVDPMVWRIASLTLNEQVSQESMAAPTPPTGLQISGDATAFASPVSTPSAKRPFSLPPLSPFQKWVLPVLLAIAMSIALYIGYRVRN